MKIKYMGSADVRRLEKGENFGGRLADPLGRDIEWNWENNHVIDTDEFNGVEGEFWNLLLEEPDFKDVSDLKRIPTNEAQQIWRGMAKSVEAVGDDEGEDPPDPSVSSSGKADTDTSSSAGGKGTSEASGGGPTTTTGGSTRGGGGRSGRS